MPTMNHVTSEDRKIPLPRPVPCTIHWECIFMMGWIASVCGRDNGYLVLSLIRIIKGKELLKVKKGLGSPLYFRACNPQQVKAEKLEERGQD
jgi:hypothetical protein